MATATIVTRISSDNDDLAGQISNQMGLSKAWVPVSAVLLLFGLVPGMPNTLFLIGSLISGIIAWYTSKQSDDSDTKLNQEDTNEENPGKIDMDEVLITLQFLLILVMDLFQWLIQMIKNLQDHLFQK